MYSINNLVSVYTVTYSFDHCDNPCCYYIFIILPSLLPKQCHYHTHHYWYYYYSYYYDYFIMFIISIAIMIFVSFLDSVGRILILREKKLDWK